MSNPKLKSENYQNMSGIDSKTSQYLTNPMSFLDIKNMDFQTPGALTQRWGTTMYVGQTLPQKTVFLSEFSKLDGSSYVLFGCTGAIYFGATTGQSQGMSFAPSVTLSDFSQILYVFTTPSAAINQVNSFPWPYLDNPAAIFLASFTLAIAIPKNGNNVVDSVPFVNNFFCADGQKYFKFNGSSNFPVGLPPAINDLNGFSTYGVTGGAVSNSLIVAGGGASGFGYYYYYASLVNNRGFEGPIWPLILIGFKEIAAGTSTPSGSSYVVVNSTIKTPLEYGISSINLYSFFSPTYAINPAFPFNYLYNVWQPDYVKVRSINASGSTVTSFLLGTTVGNIANLTANIGAQPNSNTQLRFPLGGTVVATVGNNVSSYVTNYDIDPLFPQFIETFQNRIFIAGFTAIPSTVYFSDNGEPEGYRVDSNFEVRTNDSDYITALKAYQTKLYIFKKNSFHVFSGDNPQNFFLQEVSLLYGCLNNRSCVTFENILLFLDRKGMMMFNGANVECLSNKIQPIFERMNYDAAILESCMVHDKLRNQILCAIPVDGSSTNNLVVVYDYLAGSWTTHTGYSPSIFAAIQGRNNSKNVFFGDYNGRINWQGASFLQDNGAGYTLSFKTRFLHDMGESIQKQFRRLYLNADPVGSTLAMPLRFYQDYGSSTVYSTTFVLGAFQNRIDYGISAKSLAFEMFNINASGSPLRIYGFTIESRLQRRV